MTVWVAVECPHCHSSDVVKNGKSAKQKQRYLCQNDECPYRTFILEQSYPGRLREVKEQITEMTLNGSGIRDIARVLKVSPTTVIKELKKNLGLSQVNQKLLETLNPENIEVDFIGAEESEQKNIVESELDEMWSYVGNKRNQRWLWHAIERRSGQVLAYAFGRRTDEVFLLLKELLEPFGIRKYCTDGWGAYERHIPEEQHEIDKRKTQRIERKHLGLRTRIKRLARKTICFSRSEEMHDLVIGLFINRYEFGMAV